MTPPREQYELVPGTGYAIAMPGWTQVRWAEELRRMESICTNASEKRELGIAAAAADQRAKEEARQAR